MRGLLMVAAACLLTITACSGAEQPRSDDESSPTVSSEAPSTTAPAPPTLTMIEVCPQVEATLPNDIVAELANMKAFDDELTRLYSLADLESQNALSLLMKPTNAFIGVIAADESGLRYLEARSAWIDGISAFADRCLAAGSSALQ